MIGQTDFEIMKYFGIFTFETQVQNHNAGRGRETHFCAIYKGLTFLKIFIGLKNESLLHAQTGSLSIQFCM